MRGRALDEVVSRSATLSRLFHKTPLEFGLDTLFYGSRRDTTRAVASTWATRGAPADDEVAIDGGVQATHVGKEMCDGGAPVYVTVSSRCIEVDLDSASSAEARTILGWVHGKVRNRHVLNGRHVVVLHAAERVPDKSIASLQALRTAIVVLSTTAVDAHSVASLSGFFRVRVPCPTHVFREVPEHAFDALRPLVESVTVQAVREAVNKLSRYGFDVAEISRFAWTTLGERAFESGSCDERARALGTVAQLAHSAHGVSQLDRRALETLIVAIAAGPACVNAATAPSASSS